MPSIAYNTEHPPHPAYRKPLKMHAGSVYSIFLLFHISVTKILEKLRN